MDALLLALFLAEATFPAYPLPGMIANGPAPILASPEDAALCEDALWVDEKGLPSMPKDIGKYQAARAACDCEQRSRDAGI